MQRLGFFLSIEGGEGVGKTAFLKNLQASLQARFPSWPLFVTREPGGTGFAEEIRKLFLKEANPEQWLVISDLCLMSAARAQHVTYGLKPALERKELVISDRFTDSTRVYQGVLGGLPPHLIQTLTEFCCFDLKPDLTFILDCPVEIAQKRLQQRQMSEEKSRFDKKPLSYHEQVRQGFLQICAEDPQRCKVLDAAKTQEDVLDQAIGFLLAAFEKKKTL